MKHADVAELAEIVRALLVTMSVCVAKFANQLKHADVAELVDAQDLKSCGRIIRAGSIPAICTNNESVRTTDTKINQ